MADTNEMEILTASLGKEIEIQGEKLMVCPYSWAQTIRMAKPLSVVIQALFGNYDKLQEILKTQDSTTANQVIQIASFVSSIDHADELISAIAELMAVGAKKDQQYVESLLGDDAIRLGMAVFEVNKDFFTKRLAPMLPKKKEAKK